MAMACPVFLPSVTRGSVRRPATKRTTVTRTRASASGGPPDDESQFEERLAKLRAATGRTGSGLGKKAEERKADPDAGVQATPSAVESFAGEDVFYEGPPHRGDLAVNLALGTTLLWLPLTLAAVGRALWVNYKVTSKRVSVTTNPPWATGEPTQVDVTYGKIVKCVTIGRGVGIWGDMVLTLKDGSVIEMRSLDRFLEIRKYIEERMAEATLNGRSRSKAEADTPGFA